MREITVTKKAAPYFYEKVGKHIVAWLKENKHIHVKPYDQKSLARLLDKTPSQVSRWIKGINEIPPDVVHKLINHLGFRSKYFDEYFVEKSSERLTEILTKDDLFRLVREQNILLAETNNRMFYYADRINGYMKDNRELVLAQKKLLDEIEKLRTELREHKNKEK